MPIGSVGSSSRKRSRRSRRTNSDQPIIFNLSTNDINRDHCESADRSSEPTQDEARYFPAVNVGSDNLEPARHLENISSSFGPFDDDDIIQHQFELRDDSSDEQDIVNPESNAPEHAVQADCISEGGKSIEHNDANRNAHHYDNVNEDEDEEDFTETVPPIQGYDKLLNVFDDDFSVFNNEMDSNEFEDDKKPENESENVAASTSFHGDLRDCSETAVKVLSEMRRRMNKRILLGAMTLYGQVRFTLKAYEYLSAVSNNDDGTTIVPSTTTMRQTVLPYMIKNLFVRSDRIFLGDEHSSNLQGSSSTSAKYKRQVVVVKPTAWAALDIADISVLRNISCLTHCNCYPTNSTSDLRIESTPAVRKSSAVSRRTRSLWVSKQGFPFETTTGTSVEFFFTNVSTSEREELSHLSCEFESSVHRGEACLSIKVIVQQSYSVELPIGTCLDQIGFQPSRQGYNLQLQRNVLDYLSLRGTYS